MQAGHGPGNVSNRAATDEAKVMIYYTSLLRGRKGAGEVR